MSPLNHSRIPCGYDYTNHKRSYRKTEVVVAIAIQYTWRCILYMYVLPFSFSSLLLTGIVSFTVPIYLAECAPVHIRGRLVMASTMSVGGGQTVSVIIDYCFSFLSHGWRYSTHTYMHGASQLQYSCACFSMSRF